MGGSDTPSGTCWFCGRGEGRGNSVALPFWSNLSDEVRVLVLPRCDACCEFHHRQQFPSGLFIVAGAMLTMLPVSLLPIPEGALRTVAMVLAMLVGFGGGIYYAANREARDARARGTRPLHDYVQHPPYRALAADTATWRQARTTGIGDGSSTRRETVTDHRLYYTRIADDPALIAALERGCAEAGVGLESRA